MTTLAGKTLFITGGSRGIGLAIALRAARDGANVAIAAKTTEVHPRLPGTIYTAAREIESAGGQALPLTCDVRSDDQVSAAVTETVKRFGGIDICVNNASAISLTNTVETQMKRFDLMHQVNVRGTFLVAKTCLPHLEAADNPHILNLSPPLGMVPGWFGMHLAYTMSKMGMSMCTLGLAEEFRDSGIGVNSLWPLTLIDTAAVRNVVAAAAAGPAAGRKPAIVAAAAHAILVKRAEHCTGNFFIDEEVLRAEGEHDFDRYAAQPGTPPAADFFVPDELVEPLGNHTVPTGSDHLPA
jgi:citronellol/citronellal dehydrogenase